VTGNGSLNTLSEVGTLFYEARNENIKRIFTGPNGSSDLCFNPVWIITV